MSALLSLLFSSLASPTLAADFSLETTYTSAYVSTSTGDVVAGPSLQVQGLVSGKLGLCHAYAGVWASFELGSHYEEIDPFAGCGFLLPAGVTLDTSFTYVGDEQLSFVGVSMATALSRPFALGKEVTITPTVIWQHQLSPESISDGYLDVSARVEWRPSGWPDWKFTVKLSVACDTGAYGAAPGCTPHGATAVRWRATERFDFEFGVRADMDKTGHVHPSVRTGLSIHF